MNNDQPLVTVYIPTFNRLELLQRAVRSVQDQTYQNFEIIIVDDCSTDGTQTYLKQLVEQDSRVRYFFKEENSGACVSRNIAIENAQGEFITGLDDDDYFLENRIQEFLNYWYIKDNSTEILYSFYFRKNKLGLSPELNNIKKKLSKKKINSDDLLYFFYIGNQVFTKTELMKNNLFDPIMPAWQDFECYYRFLKNSKCYAELVPIYNYVVDISHPHERISTKKIDNIFFAKDIFEKKHKLNNKQLNLLICHLYNYPGVKIEYKKIIKRFFYKPSLLDFKRLVNFKV